MSEQPKRGPLDAWLAAAVAAGTLGLLVATIGRPVITWDEGFSIRREARMRDWLGRLISPPQSGTRGRLFSEPVINEFWEFAREEPDGHPPFYAVIGNLGWLAGSSWLPIIEAHRLGPILLFSVTLGVLYLFLARRWGRLAAATVAGAWLLMPRVFAHAHLASYDMPLACLWVLVVVAFWKAREGWERSYARGLAWSVVFAIMLALAAATKFTGWLIPLPILVWSVVRGLLVLKRDGVGTTTRLLPVAAFCALWLITLPDVIRLMREADRAVTASSGPQEFRDDKQRFARAAAIVRADHTGWLPLAAALVPPAVWVVAAVVGRLRQRPNLIGAGPVVRCWVAAAALAPTLTIFLVPNWWHDPLRGIAIFLWSNLTRQRTTWIPTQFFGTLYEFSLPWYNTLAWVALTVPPLVVLLILFGVACTVLRRGGIELGKLRMEDRRTGAPAVFDVQTSNLNLQSLAWFILVNAATLLVVRALPGAPGHDAERQLLGSFPFLACLAGLGAEWIRSLLARRFRLATANWLARAAIVVSLASAAWSTWHYRAAPLSYYTELIGGLGGAVRFGLEPAYYWDALDERAIEWLNENTRPNEFVLFGNNFDTLEYLQHSQKLRVNTRPDRSSVLRWYVLQNRPGLFAESPWNRVLAQEGVAAYTCELDGVPLIWIFPYEEYEQAVRAARVR